MELRRLTRPDELQPVLDRIIRWYDERRLAVNGSAPFHNDPLKKPFHLALMAPPGLMHVTTLTFGDHLASAHINVCGKCEVHVGVIAHDPELAKHSPGKLHLLLLSDLLRREGFEQLDLTPGGDAYKDRFVTGWDEVHELTVLPTPAARRDAVIRLGAKDAARTLLKACGVTTARAKLLVGRLTRVVGQSVRWAGLGSSVITRQSG
jgi:CelD/BcsL family acetyltransferase involved in cellulose biosynthesis